MADHHAKTAEGVARLAMDLDDADGMDETVDVSLDYARAAVGADAASVVLLEGRPGTLEVAGTTGRTGAEADQLQLDAGEGPCLDAGRHLPPLPEPETDADGVAMVPPSVYTFATVQIDDTLADNRWPVWGRRIADELDIRSVLSIQLRLPKTRIGAINLYSSQPSQFTASDRQIAELLAQHTAIALVVARRNTNLWQAIDARQAIGQAQGILMERHDLTPEKAFAVLRRYSQHNNIKLNQVAESLVRTRELPHSPPDT